ncbi:MAG: hypothetical protein DMG65_02960 [Candidatus Angelobacter sp. Gp1-AA117]|nr:MAG: hypothetical protein DMG65_02960 [Candidatus Angelobacter sp. Gp1-AA117]
MRTLFPTLRKSSALVLGLLFTLCVPAFSQVLPKSDPHLFDQVPFDQWMNEGPRNQIPLKYHVYDAQLSIYQRLVVHIQILVEGKELAKRGEQGDLLALVQITDGSNHMAHDALKLELPKIAPQLNKKTDVMFEFDAFVLPGAYTLTLAVDHTGAGEHSLMQHPIQVNALKNDPLPEMWHDLPALEFLTHIEPPDPDTFFHPELKGTLNLPVETRRPVNVELLADVTAADLFRGSSSRYMRYLYALLPVVHTFTQMKLKQGAMDFFTLDLTRHRVVFEQDGLTTLDWAKMKKTVSTTEPAVISVGNLSKEPPSPDFLREEIGRLIAKSVNETPQVFIVITSPLFLHSFRNLKSDPLPATCNCRVFYIEFDTSRRGVPSDATGQLEKMLKPLKVQSFRAHNAEAVRQALARIIHELESY